MRLPTEEFDDGGPNLTPLIDVVFLLLIFFLVATRFDEQEREISTKLAEVTEAQPLSMPPNELIINVTDKGKYIVSQQELTEKMLRTLLDEVATRNPGTQKVQIRADQDTKFIYPATVMGICEREKIDHYITVLQKH